MKIIVKRSLDEKYFVDVIKGINKIIKIPKDVIFYFIEKKSDCNPIIKSLPEKSKKDFIEICNRDVSFSYSHKNIKYIIIDVKNEDYLLYDTDALKGLILHELMHIKTSKLFDKKINLDLKKVLFKNIDKLKIREDNFDIVIRLMNYSKLLLKELYANENLIKNNFGNILFRYYYQQFSGKRYSGFLFNKKFKKDKYFIENILKLELSLLSVIWPLQKYKIYNYDMLLKHLQENYHIRLRNIEKSFLKLKNLYFDRFDSKNFNMLFFEEVLNVVNKRLK